ncbi:unnamed protein product [Parascedosporium putredinis]|uniref:tRNA(Phe) (4-demethylwyosine(37)-C(7)) aminocarboxypropyltransferase n=1 Tax=Parascedosporium putredinis TaxID=1442378 RepID=A0A9P1GWT7_9PEZI|nr:unnamed protein product [Parascedosporium putredinis]CAI7988443.1 unnamed protein product [Parascedosporium putredinis]
MSLPKRFMVYEPMVLLSPGAFSEAAWVAVLDSSMKQEKESLYRIMLEAISKIQKSKFWIFTGARPVAALQRRARPPGDLRDRWAVDLYAGIGYFVFSYAKLGMRVLCWEINPWSVEGLRRGALRNGWKVRVVCGEELARPTCDLVGDEQIVVFVEDNQKARGRIESLRSHLGNLEVLHVNGGLLPTSKDTWAESWEMTSTSAEAWLHLHENVGEDDVETWRGQIQDLFGEWATRDGHERRAEIEHVEKVKTIAPRVWHCVFDVYITRLSLLSKESQ